MAPLENRTGELEETSRRNSSDITRLSGEVTEARGRADRAQQTADAAQTAATDAAARADRVNSRVDAVDNKFGNLDSYSLSKTVTVTFKVNRSTLDEESMAALDALVAELQGKKGYVIEIQGFTDATGSDRRNRTLSETRAKAAHQYLAEHDIPLFRMNLLGFGEGRPVAENDTREGRAQNRRVEVRVLVSSLESGS